MSPNKINTPESEGLPVNRVANSPLITIKPEQWVPTTHPVTLDLKDFLFQGLILKEKDFRDQVSAHDWTAYRDQVLCVYCSADAIIPNWAYMIITASASAFAKDIFFGTADQWKTDQLLKTIDRLDIETYRDQPVVIKGCADEFVIGPEVYLAITKKLLPAVKSLMFGEPCSTVPVYKRPRTAG